MERPLRLALRGAGGLLGHRLLRTILSREPEMQVIAVILGTDEPSFRRLQSACRALPKPPDFKVLVDARRQAISELTRTWDSPWTLEPLNQSWGELKRTDALVDTAIVPGHDAMRHFLAHYGERRPVIYQSGTYPAHQLVAGPFEPPRNEGDCNYRQGDCLLSGIAPVLFPFAPHIEHIDLHLLVQRQKRLNDYTLRDNLDDGKITPDLLRRVKDEVLQLLPHLEKEDVSIGVFEVPGLDDYICDFKLVLDTPQTREEVLHTLKQQPRLFVAPKEIPISTGQVRQRLREPYLENGHPLQPIVCFEHDGGIEVEGRELTLRATFYSKAITMLPNIDAIRALVRGMTLKKAMEQTDQNVGFMRRP